MFGPALADGLAGTEGVVLADACGVPELVGLRPATGIEFPLHVPSTRSAAAAVPALMAQMQQLTRGTRRYGSLTWRPHLRVLVRCGPGRKVPLPALAALVMQNFARLPAAVGIRGTRSVASCSPSKTSTPSWRSRLQAYMLAASWTLRIPTSRAPFCFPMK